MTELAITPKWKDKEAKFRGVVAAGEHVAVTIQNDDGSGNAFISDTETLRLNVIDPTSGRLLATFPTPVEDGETPETWSESGTQLSCELNLNTVQMLKAVLPASVASLLFVLDDYENKTLYFKAQHEVAHWPRRRGEEEPLNLDGYKDIIRVFGLRLTAVEETATSAAASAARAATSSATSAQAAAAAAAAATGSQGSAANSATAAETAKTGAETARDEAKEYAESAESVLANAATKGALQAEIDRASQAELGLSTHIDAVDVNVTNLLGGEGSPDMNKSVRHIAGEEVAKVVANAPADLDTLKEIADYIESDKTGAAQMVTQIDANTKAISAEVKRAQNAEAALDRRVKTLEDNGGGSTPVLVPCTVEETNSVIKINPTTKAPQASYYVNDKLNIGESVSRTWGLGLEFYLSVVDPADFSETYRGFVKQTLEPDEYTILEELTGSGYNTTGQVRIRIEKDVIIKDEVYGDIIRLPAGMISASIDVSYGVMDDGYIFLSPIVDALNYYFSEWDFIHPDSYFMTTEADCFDLYTTSVESRKINGEIILPDSFSNIRHSWFISFENGVNPHGYITFKGENEGVFIDTQSNSNRSNVFAGRNVWQIVEVAEEIFSVNRIYPCSEDSITLSSPSGRQAQLTVNDELVLEVKEV